MDALLGFITERIPDFRVVLKAGFCSFMGSALGNPDGVRSFAAGFVPFVSSNRWSTYPCRRSGEELRVRVLVNIPSLLWRDAEGT